MYRGPEQIFGVRLSDNETSIVNGERVKQAPVSITGRCVLTFIEQDERNANCLVDGNVDFQDTDAGDRNRTKTMNSQQTNRSHNGDGLFGAEVGRDDVIDRRRANVTRYLIGRPRV